MPSVAGLMCSKKQLRGHWHQRLKPEVLQLELQAMGDERPRVNSAAECDRCALAGEHLPPSVVPMPRQRARNFLSHILDTTKSVNTGLLHKRG